MSVGNEARAGADIPVAFRAMERSETDLSLFRECFARNSERPRSLESLQWQYFANPTRKIFVDFAVPGAEPRVAAIYATMPGSFRIAGRPRLAVQSVDTLTDADYRGRGLFVRLAEQTYSRAAAGGAALVYGFPNGNSAHGFFKRLGWTNLDPIPFVIRPIRTRYFVERIGRKAVASLLPDVRLTLSRPRVPRNCRLVRLHELDERVTELWRDFARDVDIALERDASYLTWRIRARPHEPYEIVALERDDRLEALCIYGTRDKHGGRIGYVMELLHRRDSPRAGKRLLSIALHDMADAGTDAVLAWSFAHAPNHRAYRNNLFVPMPEKLRPIELHFGARALDPDLAAIVGDPRRWYLSYVDADTV